MRAEERDLVFMRRALRLARRGIGRTSPNPAVGCVLVRRGEVVGEAWHTYDGLDHAEVRALARAGTHARGATAYATLEPCSHHGRTGPCAEALVRAGVRRVVAAMVDPNPRVSGRGLERLRRAGIEVSVGLESDAALALNEPFVCHAATGRPLVVSKLAMSLDGRIATAAGASRWITSVEGRRFGQRLRLELDAILVGIGTVLADDPQLLYRGTRKKSRPLLRVVVDGRLRTPVGARLFAAAGESPVLIACADDAPVERRRRLEARGAEVLALPRAPSGVDLDALLAELGRRRILGVLVEGGSAIHGSFMSEKLVDKLYFIVAPIVLGGVGALPAIGGRGFATLAEAPRLHIVRELRAGPDRVLEAYPPFSRSIRAPAPPPERRPSAAPGRGRASGRR